MDPVELDKRLLPVEFMERKCIHSEALNLPEGSQLLDQTWPT